MAIQTCTRVDAGAIRAHKQIGIFAVASAAHLMAARPVGAVLDWTLYADATQGVQQWVERPARQSAV